MYARVISLVPFKLISLDFMLLAVAIFKTPDVRPVLKAYEGKNIPIEYGKKEAEMKRKHIEEWEHSRKGLSRGGLTLSGLFGGSEQVCLHPFFPYDSANAYANLSAICRLDCASHLPRAEALGGPAPVPRRAGVPAAKQGQL